MFCVAKFNCGFNSLETIYGIFKTKEGAQQWLDEQEESFKKWAVVKPFKQEVCNDKSRIDETVG